MEALYRAAVGSKNADYYVSRFLRFDEPGASRLSWHWPAFFIGFYWGLYRRMYGNALIYCLLVPFCIGVCVALALVMARITTLTPLRVVMLTYSWILIPIFANSIYHKFIARRIKEVQAKVPDPRRADSGARKRTPYQQPRLDCRPRAAGTDDRNSCCNRDSGLPGLHHQKPDFRGSDARRTHQGRGGR